MLGHWGAARPEPLVSPHRSPSSASPSLLPVPCPVAPPYPRAVALLGALRSPAGVDGPIGVAPSATDPDGGRVAVPRPAARPEVPARPLLELGGEALDPAIQADVVDRDPAVGEHPLEVALERIA